LKAKGKTRTNGNRRGDLLRVCARPFREKGAAQAPRLLLR